MTIQEATVVLSEAFAWGFGLGVAFVVLILVTKSRGGE